MGFLLWEEGSGKQDLRAVEGFDGFINDVMFYFYLVAVMVGITGLTGFSYFGRRSKVKLVCDLKSRRCNVIMQVLFS